MDELISALQGDRNPGLYQSAADLDLEELAASCQEQDFQLGYFNGATITTKAEFLSACATALKFPSSFGSNWDALEECLTDLEWLPASGYLLLYSHPKPFAQAHPKDWKTLIEIFQSAIDEWNEADVPMYIVFSGDRPLLAAIETL
ncbi:MAG: barnase inhibitor [Leptolyngbya sp.]|nr:MAG: barnase inhibitor [Leptolyngbya sp.]